MRLRYANRLISILYRYGQRFFVRQLRQRGLELEVGQLPALMQIYRAPGITQEEIAQNTGMDKGTTARSVQRLCQLGLALRQVDAADRRLLHIYATEKGESCRAQLEEMIADLHSALYRGFTPQEIETAFALLERMKENMAAQVAHRR